MNGPVAQGTSTIHLNFALLRNDDENVFCIKLTFCLLRLIGKKHFISINTTEDSDSIVI